MAKLTYITATMNTGKSTALLQKAFTYKERGYNTMIFTSAYDDRYGIGKVTSRIGIDAEATVIPSDDLEVIQFAIDKIQDCINCFQAVFVDECQFLSKKQVDLLSDIVDNYDVDVFCYGIKTDYTSTLFDGSRRLLEIADETVELDGICKCGAPSKLNARLVNNTETVLIGGNDVYDTMCRKCYKKHMQDGTSE